jgi:hypothetical protein
MKEDPTLQLGTDKMTLRQSMTKFLQSDSLTEVNGKVSFTPIGKGDYSGTQTVPR